MLVDGKILSDGMDMIGYLDEKLHTMVAEGKVSTGIIISSAVRKELAEACQKTMGMKSNPSETVNRYRGVLLIEDGDNSDRLEVVGGRGIVAPVEGDPFENLKKVRP